MTYEELIAKLEELPISEGDRALLIRRIDWYESMNANQFQDAVVMAEYRLRSRGKVVITEEDEQVFFLALATSHVIDYVKALRIEKYGPEGDNNG